MNLGRILDYDHALVRSDERGECIEERGLASPCSARNQNIHAVLDRATEDLQYGRGEAPDTHQFLGRVTLPVEFPDGEDRSRDRAWRQDGRYPRSVGQPGIQERLLRADIVAENP